MKKAVIFDLDGTLWETVDSNYVALNTITKKYNLGEISRELIYENYGNSITDSAKFFFPDLEQDKAIQILIESDEINIRNLESNGAFIYPGLEEVLFNLSEKYDLYIVSNTVTKKYIEAFLTSSKLFKYFKDYVAASEIKLSKGNSLIKLMDDYYIDEAIYIGDTLKDYEAAKIANIPFVQCLYGFGKDLQCEYSVDKVTELPKVVDSIFNNMGGTK